MAFLTDRKRANSLGSARSGTEHHQGMTMSSYGLLILVPLFVFTFGPMIGENHADVLAYFANPCPALIAAMTIVVSLVHFKNGIRMTFEDYAHGFTREALIIITNIVCYGAAAAGLFAIASIAL